MPNYLIYFCLLFFCSSTYADEQKNINELSQHPYWHKLLHFSEKLFSSRSDIESPEYFLARDGQVNPESELLATIDGLKNSEKIYCSFPSRRIWLEKMGLSFPSRNCPEYEAWTRGNSVKSLSLIFASGFLGNPASYFGHPLLKLNFKDKRSPLDLLDTAINYGAFTPPDVGALPYAFKGIFGGYDAGFTSADFFFHKNNYSELELRDLWEYELDLSPLQVEQIVSHLWDLRSARISYYFFNDNCAYRMAELLDLAMDDESFSSDLPFAIPASIFHKLHEYKLIKDIKLLGSRQTRLREKVFSLNRLEQAQLKLVSSNPEHADSEEFKALSELSRSKILEAALDYFSYRSILDKDEENKQNKKKILKQRFALPATLIEWKKIPQRPPHEAQKPVLTQIGFFYSEKFKESGSFRFRPVFYDIISPDAGRPSQSSLSVFDLELNFNEQKLWLKSFNLISIESLNISKTKLPDDGGQAWRLKLGAGQINLACQSCEILRLDAGIGKAWELSNSLVLYAMIDPRLQSQYKNSGNLSLTPNVSALITFTEEFRVNAMAGKRYFFNSDQTIENIYLIEGRIGSNRNWDIRLSFQEHVDRWYSAGVGFYW